MADLACILEGCEKAAHARQLCPMHYQRLRLTGTTDLARKESKPRKRRVGVEPCEVDGCDKPISARGWCVAHWTRWKRHGSPTARMRGEVVDGKRVCSACQIDKPLKEFANPGESWCRACFNDKQRLRARERYVPVVKTPARCDQCGTEFMADKRRNTFCSKPCFEAGKYRRNMKNTQARRARQRAVTVETFSPSEVYERDGWACGLCGDPIDREAVKPHPLSPSIDHVIPISRGGEHSLRNVQAAHLGCNVRKGARLIAAVT